MCMHSEVYSSFNFFLSVGMQCSIFFFSKDAMCKARRSTSQKNPFFLRSVFNTFKFIFIFFFAIFYFCNNVHL